MVYREPPENAIRNDYDLKLNTKGSELELEVLGGWGGGI